MLQVIKFVTITLYVTYLIFACFLFHENCKAYLKFL